MAHSYKGSCEIVLHERRIMSEWHKEMATKPKLSLLNMIFDLGLAQRCWRVQDRVIHSIFMKLRGGTAHFQVETGAWQIIL